MTRKYTIRNDEEYAQALVSLKELVEALEDWRVNGSKTQNDDPNVCMECGDRAKQKQIWIESEYKSGFYVGGCR